MKFNPLNNCLNLFILITCKLRLFYAFLFQTLHRMTIVILFNISVAPSLPKGIEKFYSQSFLRK